MRRGNRGLMTEGVVARSRGAQERDSGAVGEVHEMLEGAGRYLGPESEYDAQRCCGLLCA